MYWQDLSDTQLNKVKEYLRTDIDVVTPNLTADEQDEEIDDWMNRNNDTKTVLETLAVAYGDPLF